MLSLPGLYGFVNGWEAVAILAIVLIIFGAKKLPELARGLGQGIREFKKSSREIVNGVEGESGPPVRSSDSPE